MIIQLNGTDKQTQKFKTNLAVPAGEDMFSNTKYWWIPNTIMFLQKLLQQIPHF